MTEPASLATFAGFMTEMAANLIRQQYRPSVLFPDGALYERLCAMTDEEVCAMAQAGHEQSRQHDYLAAMACIRDATSLDDAGAADLIEELAAGRWFGTDL